MRKLIAMLLTAAMPLTGIAQPLAPGADAQTPLLEQILSQNHAASDATGAHAMPLWSTPDGRILTMVASASSSYPTLPLSPQIGSPSQWQLVDVTNIVSGGLLMRLNPSTSAYARLTQSTILAPAAAPCAAYLPCAGSAAHARGGDLHLGANWLIGDTLALDVNYGQAWLHSATPATAPSQPAGYDLLSGIGNTALPTLLIPGAEFADMQNSSVNALGRLRVNDNQAFDLGATLSRIQLSVPGAGGGPLTSLNQAALSFGVEYGAFTGTLTGRVLGPAEPFGLGSQGNARWTGLDVGISWRTPWSGLFRLGAQNLWSSGNLPYINEPAARELDASQARVPYVQYHQDL
jgi:hypothetical protein